MERESVDGREGDDERTENERSPRPPRSRPSRTKDQEARNLPVERRIDRVNRARGNVRGPREGKTTTQDDIGRRRSRSRSALRDRDQSGPTDTITVMTVDEKPDNSTITISSGNVDQLRGNENGIKRRRRGRNRKRNNRRYKPYAELSWEERKQRDEQESERAAQRRANRPTPYNTTQFLMEDHKVDTPDLSTMNPQCDSSEEIVEDNLMNGDYLERDFSAVYEEVQSERLESMSKEQLVSEVLELQRRVAELEDEQKNRPSSAGESDQSSSEQQKGLRTRLESLSSLEGEVERLRSENTRLRKASLK